MNIILLKDKSTFNKRFDYCVIQSPQKDTAVFVCKKLRKHEYNVTLYLAFCNNDELRYREDCILYTIDFEVPSVNAKRGLLSEMLTTLEHEENILYPEVLASEFGGSICELYKKAGTA